MVESEYHHYDGHREQKPQHFCPLCLCIGVTKEDTVWSNTGWNNAFTHIKERHRRARVAPTGCTSTPWRFASEHLSHAAGEGSQPSPVESEILKAAGMAEAHWCTCFETEWRNIHWNWNRERFSQKVISP